MLMLGTVISLSQYKGTIFKGILIAFNGNVALQWFPAIGLGSLELMHGRFLGGLGGLFKAFKTIQEAFKKGNVVSKRLSRPP